MLEELINELIFRNLIVYDLYPREHRFWVDEPLPEKDLELGDREDSGLANTTT